jgi:hypothetical protein
MYGIGRAHCAGELYTAGMVSCTESAQPCDALGCRSPRGAYDVYFKFPAERQADSPVISTACDTTF